MDEIESKSYRLLTAGTEMIGSAAGAAIGLLGGPVCSLAGAASGPIIVKILKRVCAEIYDRQIGTRQRIRAGATAAVAIHRIKNRLDSGDKIRGDGFFEKGSRSSAEEIFEGVIIKSHNEHEEKKAEFYANIFVTATFDSRFSRESLNHFLSLGARLTYRQLCLLQFFRSSMRHVLSDAEYDWNYLKSVSFEKLAVLHELYDLYQVRLLKCQSPGDDHPDDYMAFDQVRPSWMFLSDLGERLHYLMQLQALAQDDLKKVASFFTGHENQNKTAN